jgi:spore coat polysaccharide biosynthesis protein SpsF
MKIIVITQARTGSTRFPNKILQTINGKTILELQLERMQASKLSSKIIVATTTNPNDDIIVQLCKETGYNYYRGNENDLLDRHYQLAKLEKADVVVKIPSDCPLIDPDIIDKVIHTYMTDISKYDYVSNLHPPTYPDGNDVEVMRFSALETAWENSFENYEREHTTPYLWDNNGQFTTTNFKWETGLNYSMSHRFTLDYYEDFLFIKAVYEKLYKKKVIFSLDDIITLLEKKPKIRKINEKYLGVNWYRHHLGQLKTINEEMTVKLEEVKNGI